jgi:AcrR family transcriptional regulator
VSPRVDDDRILDATIAVVIAHGYSGATTRQIATQAGVNEVTLFRRFESKARLVQAAIHRDLAQTTRTLQTPTGDLAADLLAVLERYCATFTTHAALPLVIILEVTRNPELADLIEEPAAAQLALRELMASYQADGQLIDEPPAVAVNALLGPLLAHAVNTQLGIATTPLPSPQTLLDGFLGGHSARNRAALDVDPASAARECLHSEDRAEKHAT